MSIEPVTSYSKLVNNAHLSCPTLSFRTSKQFKLGVDKWTSHQTKQWQGRSLPAKIDEVKSWGPTWHLTTKWSRVMALSCSAQHNWEYSSLGIQLSNLIRNGESDLVVYLTQSQKHARTSAQVYHGPSQPRFSAIWQTRICGLK